MNELKPQTETRNSTIEILRIIAMLCIICSHYSVHGGVNNIELLDTNMFNAVILQFSVLGNLGVDIFVILTGYYMVKTEFRIEKFIRLILMVWFYSVAVYAVFSLTGLVDFSWREVLRCAFPTITCQYWFFTAYVVLFLLSPFLNKMISALNRKQFATLCIIMVVLWSVIPTVSKYYYMYGTEIPQFLMMYVLGAYFRLCPPKKLSSTLSGGIIALIAASIMFLSTLWVDFHIDDNPDVAKYAMYCYGRMSVPTLAFAIGLLILFVNLPEWHNSFVNRVAGCVFGVYLLHDNYFVRQFIWTDIFHNSQFAQSDMLVLHMAVTVITVFIAGTVIEYLRQILLERHYMKVIVKVINKIV